MSTLLSFEAIFVKMHIFCTVACFCCHQGIETNGAQWSALFEPYLFFESYKNYLQVDIRAEDDEDLRLWKGWVESRLRQLTLKVNINASCFIKYRRNVSPCFHSRLSFLSYKIYFIYCMDRIVDCSLLPISKNVQPRFHNCYRFLL